MRQRQWAPADKTLIGVRGGEQTARVDALDPVLRGPGDEVAVIDCDGMSETLWVYAKRKNTRTNPLLARLEHTRGDRAQTLHPHHALAVDVVHEEAFAGNWTENSARSFHICIDISMGGTTYTTPSRAPGSSWCA